MLEKVPEQPEPIVEAPPCASAKTGPVFRGCPLSYYVMKLNNSSPDKRLDSIRAIGTFGTDAGSAASEIAAALSDPDPNVRGAAAAALGQIGPVGASAIPALAKALSDSNPRIRDLAAVALQAMGPKAAPAVPQLISALNDPVDYVRAPVADALGAIGPQARAAVRPLAERLLTKDEGFVLASVKGLRTWRHRPRRKGCPPRTRTGSKECAGWVRQPKKLILKIEGKPVPTYH